MFDFVIYHSFGVSNVTNVHFGSFSTGCRVNSMEIIDLMLFLLLVSDFSLIMIVPVLVIIAIFPTTTTRKLTFNDRNHVTGKSYSDRISDFCHYKVDFLVVSHVVYTCNNKVD